MLFAKQREMENGTGTETNSFDAFLKVFIIVHVTDKRGS